MRRRTRHVLPAIALSLSIGSGGLAPVAAWGGSRRDADRVIERRVRGAIRADPFLASAAQGVKVTSRRGVLRLVGRVGSAKERSSIAFKAGQVVPVSSIDDRVTIGDAIQRAGQ